MVKIKFPTNTDCQLFINELDGITKDTFDEYIGANRIRDLIFMFDGCFVNKLKDYRVIRGDKNLKFPVEYIRNNITITEGNVPIIELPDPLVMEYQEEEEELNAPVLNEAIVVDYTKELDGIKKELHDLNRNMKELINIMKRRK